jgi:hypothetical protein
LPWQIKCECGWEKIYRNPVAARYGGEAHLPFCSFFSEALAAKGGRREENMAKNPNQSDPFDDDWGLDDTTTTPGGGEMPASTARSRAPFIKPHDIGAIGSKGTLELIRVTGETSDYSDVILAIQYNGKDFRLGLRTFSTEYESLSKKFGTKRADWHGTLRFKVVDNNGKPYVSVRA